MALTSILSSFGLASEVEFFHFTAGLETLTAAFRLSQKQRKHIFSAKMCAAILRYRSRKKRRVCHMLTQQNNCKLSCLTQSKYQYNFMLRLDAVCLLTAWIFLSYIRYQLHIDYVVSISIEDEIDFDNLSKNIV